MRASDQLADEIYGLHCDIGRLEVDNAKLRNAVSILVHCMSDVDGCDSCPINGNPYDVQGKWSACDALREMLLGLGIEVNE